MYDKIVVKINCYDLQNLLNKLIAALGSRNSRSEPEENATLIMEVDLDLNKHPPAELANIDSTRLTAGQVMIFCLFSGQMITFCLLIYYSFIHFTFGNICFI